MKNLSFLLCSLFLTGCISTPVKSPMPEGFTGDTAIIWDSENNSTERKADLFYADIINGIDIEDSSDTTYHYNRGRGLSMYPVVTSRRVPAGKLTVELKGRTIHAAPILAIIGDVFEIKGTVTIEAKPDSLYVIKGTLSEGLSSIWIEDMNSGEVVSNKITSTTPNN